MKFKKLFLILTVVLFMGACTSNKESEKPKEITKDPFAEQGGEKVSQDYAYNQGPIKEGNLEYNGKNATLEYFIENTGNEANFGFLIFVNGRLQEYTENGKTSFMHTYNIKSDEKKIVSASFIPSLMPEEKEFTIRYGTILNPSIISSIKGIGHNHGISTTIAHNENVTAISSEISKPTIKISDKTKLSTEDLNKYKKDGEQSISMLDEVGFLEFYQDGKELRDSFDNTKDVEIRILGKPGEYTFFTLEDATPNKDIQYYKVVIEKNTYASVKLPIKKGVKNLMGVLVPKDNNARVEFSRPLVYENEK